MNKLDEHIRKNLNTREIQPSTSAWDRVEKGLESESRQNRKAVFLWLATAASIALILALSFFFRKEEPALQMEVSDIDPTLPLQAVPSDGPMDRVLETQVEIVPVEIVNSTPEVAAPVLAVSDQAPDSLPAQNLKRAPLTTIPTDWEVAIEDKVNELLSQVIVLNKRERGITDKEIDSLLRKAEQELFARRVIPTETEVDAMTLLAEVEEELDQSFRENLFERLKDGLYELKDALVLRDQ